MVQTINPVLIAGVLICSLLLVSLCTVLVRLYGRERARPHGSERFESKTKPLEDLDSDSISFLIKHPALRCTFVRELRRERRKVLREYLCRLRSDFNRTCADIRAAMVESAEDRPDLAHAILKQQVLFRMGLLHAECSMSLEALGLAVVDFDSIIDALGLIKFNLTGLFVSPEHQAS